MISHFRVFVCGLCLLMSAGGLQGRDVVEDIDGVMGEFIEFDLFSGTVLVARNGLPVYARAFGEANKDHHVANTLETRFNIGSIGKTLTGTAVMQLVERGKIELDAPVVRYLEDFPYGDKITIHHLLSHTSGMFNYMAHPEYRARMTRLRTIDDFLSLIYDQHLVFENPGGRFAYSNSGIVVLGAVIEKVSGMPYEQFISKNILVPAGMMSTGINFWDEVVPNRAMGYSKGLSGTFTAAVYQVPPACADGGLETTVLDMLRFDRALYGDALLSEESKMKMYTPNLDDYGYTWTILDRDGRKSISHGGGAPGVSAMFLRFPDDDITIIVLSNYSGAAFDPARAIEAIMFGDEYDTPKPPMGEALYRAIESGEIEATPAGIKAELERGGYDIRSPQDLNFLGYEFLGEREIDAAIAVFELNVDQFPDDANSFDSLGEAYLLDGQREKGIAAYKKALEVDPGFENARQVLDRIGAQ